MGFFSSWARPKLGKGLAYAPIAAVRDTSLGRLNRSFIQSAVCGACWAVSGQAGLGQRTGQANVAVNG